MCSSDLGRADYTPKDAAHTLRERCTDSGGLSASKKSTHFRLTADMVARQRLGADGATWFEVEPDVGCLVYGVADDLVPGAVKALGNGQVPLQAATAWMMLGGPL